VRQAELAKAYGVRAFCFHYYWFSGKRLLEAPLDAFLRDRSIDLSFTLCWANENWTRKWDGRDDRVLIAQQHSYDDHVAVFEDMARYLEDDRALRVSGKPMLMVYRPALIPDVRIMVEAWRDRAQRRGWPGLYLVASNGFHYDSWRRDGFDALCEFPPHGVAAPHFERDLAWLNTRHGGRVFDYKLLAASEAKRLTHARLPVGRTVFPGVMPSWDNEARRPGGGSVYHGATPGDYERWLSAAVGFAIRELPTDSRFVFINAWNEWAEGAYLEPDRRYGRAFLAATADALREAAALADFCALGDAK
jgi:lipopolysaccharide biosynthesis protein